MTDPIADMFNRIKNSQKRGEAILNLPHSKIKAELLKLFAAEGYIEKYEVIKKMGKQFLRVNLKIAKNKKPVIRDIKRVSRPGRRIYVSARQLTSVMGGFGTAIISTSKGLLSDEAARAQKLGGEILCQIW